MFPAAVQLVPPLVVVMARPVFSTAAQKLVVGQDTELKWAPVAPESMPVVPVQVVPLYTSPWPSTLTVTQKVVVAHETDVREEVDADSILEEPFVQVEPL